MIIHPVTFMKAKGAPPPPPTESLMSERMVFSFGRPVFGLDATTTDGVARNLAFSHGRPSGVLALQTDEEEGYWGSSINRGNDYDTGLVGDDGSMHDTGRL